MSDDTDFLTANDIRKSFRVGRTELQVLRGVSVSVKKNTWTALLGASGSGKTTLLDILGTISKPDSGTIKIGNEIVSEMREKDLVHFRLKNIGFIFQAYHILPELSVLENVMLPAMLNGDSKQKCRQKAMNLLDYVGLKDRLKHRPGELSGGEQQRAAIARALINEPSLLLADEPTGNLDYETGREILKLFQDFREKSQMTILMVTHDRTIANLADTAVELQAGYIGAVRNSGQF